MSVPAQIYSDKTTNEGMRSCYLAGVLGQFQSANIGKGTYRKYVSDITTSTVLRGVQDIDHKITVYNIGTRDVGQAILAKHGDHVPATDCSIRVSEDMAAQFAGAARRYTNFAGDFGVCELAGVIERLSKAIGLAATGTHITTSDLRGGGNVEIVSINHTTAPVGAAAGHVWVPKCADAPTRPNTFAALLAAVNGEGGTLVTDVLALDQNNNVIIPDASGPALIEGCYHALRIIGSNYEQACAGDVFAYAMTRGIHQALTVVGHTDEGGHMRSVLRVGRFKSPYGGIDFSLTGYLGLPKAMSHAARSFVCLADSIALTTAAAVADCDPTITYRGLRYPTVITSHKAKKYAAGSIPTESTTLSGEMGDSIALDIAQQICDCAGEFSTLYLKALQRIFRIDGDSGAAYRHLMVSFTWAAMHPERHLQRHVVSPWFWIEPTTLSELPAAEFPAVAAGFGHLVGVNDTKVLPLLPEVTDGGSGNGNGALYFEWRSARTVGLFLHLQLHKRDGLANIILRQAEANAFGLVGAGDAVSDRLVNGQDVASYLWGRGHSMIIAPSECIYTGGMVGALTKYFIRGTDDEFDVQPTHLPLHHELLTGDVTIRASRPMGIRSGTLTGVNKSISALRTSAIDQLSRARRMFGWEGSMGFMEPCTSGIRPGWGPRPPQDVFIRGPKLADSSALEQARKVAAQEGIVGGPSAGEVGSAAVTHEREAAPSRVGVEISEQQEATQSLETKTGPPLARTYVAGSIQAPARTSSHAAQAPVPTHTVREEPEAE